MLLISSSDGINEIDVDNSEQRRAAVAEATTSSGTVVFVEYGINDRTVCWTEKTPSSPPNFVSVFVYCESEGEIRLIASFLNVFPDVFPDVFRLSYDWIARKIYFSWSTFEGLFRRGISRCVVDRNETCEILKTASGNRGLGQVLVQPLQRQAIKHLKLNL